MANESMAMRALKEAKIHLSDIPYYKEISTKENYKARVLAFKKNFQEAISKLSEYYFLQLIDGLPVKLGKHLGELVLYKRGVTFTKRPRKSLVNWEETMKKGKRVLWFHWKWDGVDENGKRFNWIDKKYVLLRLKYLPSKEANKDIMKKYYHVKLTSLYQLYLKGLFSDEDPNPYDESKLLALIQCHDSFKDDYAKYKEQKILSPKGFIRYGYDFNSTYAEYKKYFHQTTHWRTTKALANRTEWERRKVKRFGEFLHFDEDTAIKLLDAYNKVCFTDIHKRSRTCIHYLKLFTFVSSNRLFRFIQADKEWTGELPVFNDAKKDPMDLSGRKTGYLYSSCAVRAICRQAKFEKDPELYLNAEKMALWAHAKLQALGEDKIPLAYVQYIAKKFSYPRLFKRSFRYNKDNPIVEQENTQ